MKIQIRYSNNRLDVFDTDAFTKSDPFSGTCMLTNFEVRIDALGKTGLWLTAHYYDADSGYAKQVSGENTPVAHRKRGWRFLLAEDGELPYIESVGIDGQTIMLRIADELIDMIRFEQMCELWLSMTDDGCIANRAVQLYDRLCQVFPEDAADQDLISRRCGFSSRVATELRAWYQGYPEGPLEEADEENWMEGLEHEDIS